MNENLNLVEILKDCPDVTKLYSILFGDVKLHKTDKYNNTYSICIENKEGGISFITSDGKFMVSFDGECTLFPSKEQRDWSKFKVKKPRFDPKTLQPFDKVLVRNTVYEDWSCGFFSHKFKNLAFHYRCMDLSFVFCIPYNEDTKHLVGTADEAPEYYRYWED